MKKIVLLFAALLSMAISTAQDFKTLTYFTNDSTKLDLDLFLPKTDKKQKAAGKLPLLLFVHGGGFSGGDRTSGHALCREASKNGIAAATISYTLYMKNRNFKCDGALPEKIMAFQLAANQLWQATLFFTKNADTYNIDTTKIFIAGSSAGAETVLHAAYWDRQRMALYPEKLSNDFKYAGLISGSGALMDINLVTKKNLIPMMFFHGSCDPIVPYGTAAHHLCPTDSSNWLMLFGSYSIYNRAIELNGTTQLYTYCNGGHEYSGILFEKPEPTVTFVKALLAGEKMQAHTVIATGKTCQRDTYGFCD